MPWSLSSRSVPSTPFEARPPRAGLVFGWALKKGQAGEFRPVQHLSVSRMDTHPQIAYRLGVAPPCRAALLRQG